MQDQTVISLAKLSDSLKKDNRLEKLTNHLINDYNFTPAFGVEIEFYLSKNIDPILFAQKSGYNLKPEKGDHQFEIDLPSSFELTQYAGYINKTFSSLQKTAIEMQGEINFQSKPHVNDYGSSMHFNLSFTGDLKTLEHAAQSLCHYMLGSLLVFMPGDDDYARASPRFMSPTHVSYGGNNRTTAIRIPDSKPLRLEHRISACMSDPYLIMVTILTSVLKGLKYPSEISFFKKIYGNASDAQYNLIPLPTNIIDATKLFKLDFFD